MINPLLKNWETPFGTPPFHLIRTEHFKPAIVEAITMAKVEISTISDNPDEPTFENTIAALDRAGDKLGRITSVLFNLNSADTNKEFQSAAQEVSPLLTSFSNDITLNEKLFRRIKSLYNARDTADLTTEQNMLLEMKFRNFILGCA